MRNVKKRTHTPRRGIALVELAISLLLLLVILFGIIELGSVFYVRHNMVQAAREAARTLAVQDGTAAQANAVAQDRLSPLPNSGSFQISITQPSGANPNDRDVSVEISVPMKDAGVIDPFGILSGTLKSKVTMRKEG